MPAACEPGRRAYHKAEHIEYPSPNGYGTARLPQQEPSVTLDDLRRPAVARSLLPPATPQRALDALGFVQADPIRAPARAQDLTLRHRVAGLALRPDVVSTRWRDSRSLNGRSNLFSVSVVGLWRGLMARRTFESAISTRAANSRTPVARITFPRAN